MENDFNSLNKKLKLLAEGEEIGLTPEEAIIYGIDYADDWSDEQEGGDYDG